ncbi:DAK2 domain-containing protein [Corynebacterium propinquum]|uniref:DAK2 domain-containing protein n=1 Tax=Corynebacterium propinquum TaxID=43769 RepID=UPI0026705F5A|nr:DAK2 domain-containing protein [Corynebacterium propinquum]WKS32235.1 DAK2 domain-containing protein [Corynebacterium propinquum]WKS36560.1 DAK2 domain-containing protein [Corynebacterium propinquum]WKS38730.1 DAK2 domain-containing protein [Corynebacterium propinquum]WKS42867.1 DAK2 domain-containing protein [Corynebacterium propinquum]WKS47328.1 DAK2 domain-containing protein [Corynebacterium propinquum]
MSVRANTPDETTGPATRLDGAGLRRWAQRAAAELQRRRSEINELNVYPVPDSDTGSNMSFTMDAAVAQAQDYPDEQVAPALAMGAARGARGNSGVILSQVLRGIADSCPESRLEAAQLRAALHSAVELSEKAIAAPVEGTIISVLRACAQATLSPESADLLATTRQALHAGEQALAATPSQLPELREAGVVDAGGVGLLVLLQSLVDELEGRNQSQASALATDTFASHADTTRSHNLEVMFFFTGDVDKLEAGISPLGDSLIIARVNDHEATVHIHSERAGAVLETSLEFGRPSDIRLEVLPDASAHSSDAAGANAAAGTGADANTAAATRPRHRELLAVVADAKLAELFTQAGAQVVQPEEFVSENLNRGARAVESAPPESSLAHLSVLSNGYLTAAQHEQLRVQGAEVIATDSVCAGIAAISVYDKTLPPAEATETMCEAANAMRTAVIAEPARFGEGLADEVLRVAANLVRDGDEQITVLSPLEGAIDEDALAALGVDVIVFPTETGPIELGVE